MQNVTSKKMKTIAFIVRCGSDKETFLFNMDRINKLSKEKTDIEEIIVYLVAISEKARYLRHKVFREKSLDPMTNIQFKYVTGYCNNATPPRACNYGLEAALDGPADYFVFLNDTDTIMDKNLLQYYSWLFKTAHNPEVIGAVTFSNRTAMRSPIPVHAKMFYADDVLLRGTCIKREAALVTGPFDEQLIYASYQMDYFSRMSHHNGFLVRLGKEENNFIKFGEGDISDNHKKLSFLKKHSLVWYAKKWHNKGIWADEKEKGVVATCLVRKNSFYNPNQEKNGKYFFDLFKLTDRQKDRIKERIEILYSDPAIKYAVDCSKSFVKKPLGHFTYPELLIDGAKIHNRKDLLTHVDCRLEYWKTLQWKPKKVY